MQSITLQTSDSTITSGDVLGRLGFAASSELDGADALLVAATIEAIAEGNFTQTSNSTSLVFSTADSETALPKLKITSGGHFIPLASGTYDLGSPSLPFRNLYVDGDLGIGTASPSYKLHVIDSSTEGFFAGGVWYADHTTGNGDTGFVLRSAGVNKWSIQNDESEGDTFHIRSGGFGSDSRLKMDSSTTTFNEDNLNIDFRVAGDTESNLLFVDASTDRVGIGTNSPAPAGGDTALHIHATSYPELKLTNDTTGSAAADGSLIQGDGNNLIINNRENGRIAISTNNTLAVDVSRFGTVGIGRTGTENVTVRSFHEITDNPATTITYGHFMQDVMPSGTPTNRVHYSSIVGMYANAGADMATWIGYGFSNSATSTANIDNTYGFYSPISSGIGSLSNYTFISSLNDDPTKTNRAFYSGGTAISWFGRGASISTAGALGRNYQLSMPAGGVKPTTGNQTGYLKIRLPESIIDGTKWTNTMCWFTVEVYEYSTGKSKTFKFGGYTYSVSERWLNTTATLIAGGSETTNYKVQFVNDPDGYPAVLISGPDEHTHTWNYPQVNIAQATLGYYNAEFDAMWRGEFEISYVTDSDLTAAGYTEIVEQGFSKTVTSNYAGDVGIGISTPTEKLDIRYPEGGGMTLIKDNDSNDGLLFGDMAYSTDNAYQGIKHVNMSGANDYMIISEGKNTLISARSDGYVYIRGGGNFGTNEIRVYPDTGGVVVNENGSNSDFRVEGDTDEYLLFTDASVDRVGINTSDPQEKLSVTSLQTDIAGFHGNAMGPVASGDLQSLVIRNSTDSIITEHYENTDNTSAKVLKNLIRYGADFVSIDDAYDAGLGITFYPKFKVNTDTGAITFNDQFTFPTTDGSAGQSLVTDGAGNVAWSGVSGGGSNLIRGQFTPTSSTSIFTVTGGYNAGTLDVYQNGVKLFKGAFPYDYQETDGNTTFTLTNPAASGDLIEYVALNASTNAVGNTVLATVSVTSNQTDFVTTDTISSSKLVVFLNGVKLVDAVDYNVITGNLFRLTSAAVNGDVVDYIIYGATVASSNLAKTGDTMTGNLTVNADVLIGDGNSLTIGQGGSDSFTFPDADGSANQIIETDGSGNLSWVNKPQVVTNVYTSKTTYSVATAGSFGTYIAVLNTSITPTKSSSRIRVELNISFEVTHNTIFRLFRSVNGGADTEVVRNDDGNYWSGWAFPGYDVDNISTPRTNHHIYIDSPNTALPVTYKFMIQSAGAAASTFYLNRSVNSVGTASYENAISQVILTEIPQ